MHSRYASIVVIAVLFILLTPPCFAQVGLEATFAFADSHVTYSGIDRSMPTGWQREFVPWSGGMEVEQHRTFFRIDIVEIGIAPTIKMGSEHLLRFPITYTPLRGASLGHESVHENIIDWWDPVVGNDVDLRQMLPTFGIQYLHKGVGVGYGLTRYRFTLQEYRGDDCWGCVNFSHVISQEPYGTEWGHRVSLVFYKKTESDDLYHHLDRQQEKQPERKSEGVEFYYEYQGKEVHRIGVKYICGFAFNR